MKEGFWVQVFSAVDEEHLIVEVWHGEELVFWLRARDGTTQLQWFPRRDGTPWTFSLEEVQAVLGRAREQATASGLP